MSQPTLCLVGCSGPKLGRQALAKDLYTSQLFRAARQYAERCDHWRILSARYGLLSPELRIKPYNMRLPSGTERRQWARAAASGVSYELHQLGMARNHHVIILAGKDYAELIMRDLDTWGLNCSAPMAGMGIGQRLQWLKLENGIVRPSCGKFGFCRLTAGHPGVCLNQLQADQARVPDA